MAANYQMLFELNAALGGGFASAFTQGSQQIDNMKAKLEALNAAGNTGDMLGGISAALQTAGVLKGLEAAYETLQECAQASIEFESAMTGVSKTTDMSASELQAMAEAVMQLSTEIPVTTTELANVMEVAGQLGIGKDNLLDFSTVMSQLATATTMTADEAATMLAQFANITQMDASQYSNLASAVVDLGNNYATTEQKIVDMGQGIAAAGSLAGMSEADMMGLSAAVTSLGIETAAGSTSMSKLISKLNTAVETGEGLDEFASIANMSASQFADAWGNDAANALATFITGLNDVERNGASANVILGELGITETRMQRMILSLAGSGDLMSNAIATANQAFRENTALSAEAEKRYATTESRLTMLSNAANNMKISIGDALTPMVGAFADGLTDVIEPVAEFIEQNPAIVQGLTAFTGVLGAATAAVGAYTAATKLASAANLLFGGSIPGVGIILGAAAAIGGLVFGVNALTDAYNDAHPSFEELNAQFEDLNAKAKEQQGILDMIDNFRDLNQEADNLQDFMNGNFNTEIKFTGSVNGVDKLAPDDFVDGNTVTLTAEQAALLAANSFLEDAIIMLTPEQAAFLGANSFLESTTVQLNPEQAAKLASSSFLTDTTVKLTPEQAKTLQSYQFLKSTKVQLTPEQKKLLKSAEFIDGTTTITLTAEQATKLSAAGFLDGTTVELTPEQANFLAAEGFLDGTAVQLTAEAANALAAEGYFADGTVVQLTAEKANDLQSSDFMADPTIILTGEAGNTLSASDFGLSDQTLIFMSELDQPTYEAVVAKANELSSKMAQAKTDISTAQSTLATMQSDYSALEEKISGTKNKKEKAALTEQLEELGKQIVAQKTNVEELEGNYTELETAFTTASTAAEELAGHKERLAAATQAVRDSSTGMVTAADQETEALNRQIDAYEQVTKARKDAFTADALDTIKRMSGEYAKAVEAAERANKSLADANAQKDMIDGFKAAGNAADYLHSTFESLVADAQAYEGASWLHDDTVEAQALQKRFFALQDTINALTGKKYNFFGSGLSGMEHAIETANVDILSLQDSWQVAQDKAQEYSDAAEAGAKVQQEYIQSLINGIIDGTLEEKELQETLLATYADYENGGEIVAGVMEKVTAGVNAARAAAEGSGATAQSEAETTVAAVGDIISKMEALKKAYDEAKASALAALGGRFGLFDEVGEGAESKSTAEMEKNMAAQQKYWEQYNTNLQTALDKGLAPEIAKQLSDGSAESAATLETLANASEEEIGKINESFEKVEAAKELLATTIADMETQFTEGMAALTEELASTVADLDMSSEAGEAAVATMEAYVASLDAGGEDATASATATAAAVNEALSSIQTEVTIHIGYSVDPMPSIPKPGGGGTTYSAKASGTDYAAEGVTLVGEEGPELVYMGGGEKVLTAHETVNALSGASGVGSNSYDISFQNTYNVSGGNASEIRKVLEEHDADLRGQLESILQDIRTDELRTRYH